MVKLKVTARVLTEDSYSHGILTQTSTARGNRKFLVIVRDPDESYFIGNLAVDIQKQYRRLYKQDLGKIKYLKDDDDNDLDPEQLVLDVFVNEGKAERDGLDQDATINVVQDQQHQQPLRLGSAAPDLTPLHYHSRPRRAVPRFDAVTPTLGKRTRDDLAIEETPRNDKRLRRVSAADSHGHPVVPSIEHSPDLLIRNTQPAGVHGGIAMDTDGRTAAAGSPQLSASRDYPSSLNVNGIVNAAEDSWRQPTPSHPRSRLPTTPPPISGPPTPPLAPDNHSSKSPVRQSASMSSAKFKKPPRAHLFDPSHGSEIEDSQMPKPDEPIPQPRLVRSAGKAGPTQSDESKSTSSSDTEVTRNDGDAAARQSSQQDQPNKHEAQSLAKEPASSSGSTTSDGSTEVDAGEQPLPAEAKVAEKHVPTAEKGENAEGPPLPKQKPVNGSVAKLVSDRHSSGLDSPGAQLSQTLQESAVVGSLPETMQASGRATTPHDKYNEPRRSSLSTSTSSSPRRDKIGLGITDSPRKRVSFSDSSSPNGKIPFREMMERVKRSPSVSVSVATTAVRAASASPAEKSAQVQGKNKTKAAASVQQPARVEQKSAAGNEAPTQSKPQGQPPASNEPILPAGMSLEEYEAMKRKMSLTEPERRNVNNKRRKSSQVLKKGQDAKELSAESKQRSGTSSPAEKNAEMHTTVKAGKGKKDVNTKGGSSDAGSTSAKPKAQKQPPSHSTPVSGPTKSRSTSSTVNPVSTTTKRPPAARSSDRDVSKMSDYSFVKSQGFDNLAHFGMSYGEKPDPDGFANTKTILGAIRQDHEGSAAGRQYRAEQANLSAPTLTLLHTLHTRSLTQEHALRTAPSALAAAAKVKAQFAAGEVAAAKSAIDTLMADKLIALDADKCAFAHSLILGSGATRVVEVGTSFGVSTVYLAAAVGWNANVSKGGRTAGVVIATEKEAEKCKIARENWKAAGGWD
ncbi:hypothetical protein DV738_g2683, partial [Chaetothyriales sp. CBS 135597]